MTTTTEQDTTGIAAEVATAWNRWQAALQGSLLYGTPTAELSALIEAAEAADQPLCVVWGRLCCGPHNLTLRSCCQTWVCDDHEDEHDAHCKEFEAQLREERL